MFKTTPFETTSTDTKTILDDLLVEISLQQIMFFSYIFPTTRFAAAYEEGHEIYQFTHHNFEHHNVIMHITDKDNDDSEAYLLVDYSPLLKLYDEQELSDLTGKAIDKCLHLQLQRVSFGEPDRQRP